MSRRPLAAAILSGLIISVVAIPSVAGAATIVKENPPRAVALQPAKLEKLVGSTLETTKQNFGGYWVTVAKYPSPYGSLSGISRIVYGNTSQWSKLCTTNKIRNCNLVFVGQKIYAPTTSNTVRTPVVKTPQVAPKPVVIAVSSNWVHPLRVGNPTSSCFGMRWGAMHKGIDYPAPTGAPIRSVGAGTVVKAGWNYSGYGISVMISHGGNLYTHYAHASRLAVSVGQRVVPGQVIAYVGATGDATGPHLHFEVHANGIWSQINPGPWLRARGVNTGC